MLFRYKTCPKNSRHKRKKNNDNKSNKFSTCKASRNRYGGLLEKNPDHPLNYLYSTKFGFKEDNN